MCSAKPPSPSWRGLVLWGAVGTQGLAVKDGGDPPSGHVRDGVGTAHGTKLEPGQGQMGELVGDGE